MRKMFQIIFAVAVVSGIDDCVLMVTFAWPVMVLDEGQWW